MKKLLMKIVKETGKVLMENFQTEKGVKILKFKGLLDYSIATDKMAEDYIVASLRENEIKCKIITEESGEIILGDSDYTLFVDPLDGTLYYSRGIPHFCVSLGLQKKDSMVFAIVFDPFKKEMFLAEKNVGAFLNNKKICVSKTKSLKDCFCIFAIDFTNLKRTLPIFNKLCDNVFRMRNFGSASLDLCYVACARVDAFVDYHVKPWDIAAGALIVEEAGGIVTGHKNNEWNPYNTHIVASNPFVHKKLLKVIGE